jgi:MFS family permease
VFDTLRQRDFALLWTAGLVSTTGDLALTIALMVHVYQLTDSTLATAGIFAAMSVPNIILGSVAGVFVDRWDRKRTMVWADLLRAGVLMALLFAGSKSGLWIVYVVAFVTAIMSNFFNPAESALLPNLVEKERLVAANSLNSLNDNLGRLVGPALGAAVYAWIGLGGVAMIDAASFLGSALLIRLIRAEARATPDALATHPSGASAFGRALHEWRAGLNLIWHNYTLRIVFLVQLVAFISEGFFVTLGLAPLVLDVMKGTEAQVGWIASAQAVGGLIAGAVVARESRRFSKRWLLGGGWVGLGASDFITFNARNLVGTGSPAIALAMGSMFLAGFPSVAAGAGSQSLIQSETSDAYRGRVFGALRAASAVTIMIGLAIAGVLGGRIGIVPVLTAGSVVGILSGVLALILLPRTESTMSIEADRTVSEFES